MDLKTPVLVGVAAHQQKQADFARALEPLALMERALRAAAEDAGAPGLLARAGEILVPKGIWNYSDPARLLANALGAGRATTVLAEIGVSQQSLLTRACQKIVAGEAEVVLVAGGEAKFRAQCAGKAGAALNDTLQEGGEPDVKLVPDEELWSPVESAAGLGMPVGYYAIMDSALRHKQGLSLAQHRAQMGAIYQRFSEIAADNPDAWCEQPVAAELISRPSAGNRMLAFPYTRLHTSQWNVDQAAALVFCSAGLAESLAIPRERWVFPRAFAESNFMSVVAARGDLGGCPGFRLAGAAAAARAGVTLADVQLRELYSCFPYAVRVQLEEFGIDAGAFSVTGGMSFAGGPLNNFVFQATVRMAQLLREQPGELGLVTAVSGMSTKQGVALWSTEPSPGGWGFDDVSPAVKAATDLREVVAPADGPGTVAGYTVLYQGDSPSRAVAVFDLADGRRTVAYSEDPALVRHLETADCCGETLVLSAAGIFSRQEGLAP